MSETRASILIAIPNETRAKVLSEETVTQMREFADVIDPGERALRSRPMSELLDGARVVLTGWGSPVPDPAVLAGETSVEFIAHTAGSVRFLNVREAIEAARLRVSQAASQIAPAVAEFALAAALADRRQLTALDRGVRERREWTSLRDSNMSEMLCDQTIGLVGAGFVGRLAIRLFQALDADVIVYDPYLDEHAATALGVETVPLEAIFARSDIVSLHAPNIPETHHMITREHLRSLRDGALLINTARAAIIDERVLLEHLREGRTRAVLDVFEHEPLSDDSPLFDLHNVSFAPHASGHSRGSYLRQGSHAANEARRFLSGMPLESEITVEKLDLMA